MATRYSGDLVIRLRYVDAAYGEYRVRILDARSGEELWDGTIGAPRAGFGPGIAYDSKRAYDETARAAIAFAEDDERGIGDLADMNDQGYVVRTTPWYAYPARDRQRSRTKRRSTAGGRRR